MDSAKRYLRNHIVSTVLLGTGVVGFGDLTYGIAGRLLDYPSSNPGYVAGEQAKDDANNINLIKAQDVKGLAEVRAALQQQAAIHTSTQNYRSSRSKIEGYDTAMKNGMFWMFFGGSFGLLIFSDEINNLRQKKARAEKDLTLRRMGDSLMDPNFGREGMPHIAPTDWDK